MTDVPLAYGSLAEAPAQALDNRRNFLNGKPSYILYFWELADQHQLLSSAVQRLSNQVGAADADATPSVMSGASGRRNRFDSDAVGNGLQAMADNQESYRISQERLQERQISARQQEQNRELDARRQEYLSRRLFQLQDTLRDLPLRRGLSTVEREVQVLSLEILRTEREEQRIDAELQTFIVPELTPRRNKRKRGEDNDESGSIDSSSS